MADETQTTDNTKPTETVKTESVTVSQEPVNQLTKSLNDILKRLETLEKPPTNTKPETPKENQESSPTDSIEVKRLENRLKTLETELTQAKEQQQKRDAEAKSLRFDSLLGKSLDSSQVIHKELVQELLTNRLKKNSVEKDGTFYLEDGQTVQEAVTAFLASDQGRHFLKAESLPSGTGTTSPSRTKTGKQKISTAEALRLAFLG